MDSLNELREISNELSQLPYKNRKSLTILRKYIKRIIELVQVIDVVHPHIKGEYNVVTFNDIRKELTHYASDRKCFEEGISELKRYLNTFIERDAGDIV